jgi:hypothetical protein
MHKGAGDDRDGRATCRARLAASWRRSHFFGQDLSSFMFGAVIINLQMEYNGP